MNDQTTDETPLAPEQEAEVLEFRDRLDAGEQPEAESHRTILEVWREVLKPAVTMKDTEIPAPNYAMAMCGQYPDVHVWDAVKIHRGYCQHLIDVADILEAEIESDPVCLDQSTAEDDATENRGHYLNVLLLWQQYFHQHELEWDCLDAESPVQLASFGEAFKTVFGGPGREGITDYLNSIPLEMDDADRQLIADALDEQRETWKAGRAATAEEESGE